MAQLFEFTQYISPDGQVYRFETHDKFLISFTGMGMPPISYITQRGPFQHGESYIDYRLESRVIQLLHRRNACNREDYWANRSDLINYLRPNRNTPGLFNPGVLRKIFKDGTKRDIKVYLEQGPIFQPRDVTKWDEWAITETVRFIAPYPPFYDPDIKSSAWTLNLVSQLVFPITFPIIFAGNVIDDDITIVYPGTWLSYPTITITGPMTGPKITNESTGEVIKLNYTIPAGEVVTINLEFGYKTVTNDSGVNLIGTVSLDSDLSTFHLAPDPEVSGGSNVINVTGGGAQVGVTEVCIAYYVFYIGI